jgi:tRNA pseudouridine13 synthase
VTRPAEWLRTAQTPPLAFGRVPGTGRLRCRPEDFRVDEELGFAPDGGSAHVLLHVEKSGRDTLAVARDLARGAGVPPRDVGFAGLKDRHAVTTQWFTVPQRRPPAEWRPAAGDGWRVLDAAPHSRKLRRGALRGNRFVLVVREVEASRADLDARWAEIVRRGVPNFFGPQRFGRDAGNLDRVAAWVEGGATGPGREQRAFVYSAARSLLFNAVLAARVADASWDTLVPGELVNLDGRRSWFRAEAIDDELVERCATGDVHPTGPLPGRGERPAGVAGERETAALAPYAEVAAALDAAGLEAARRACRVRLQSPAIGIEHGVVTLRFALPAGAFATVVARELLQTATDDLEESDDA